MKLIPTRHKEKLPKGFAYPLGAEAISIALQGVPQFGAIEITFSWRDEFWASKYNPRIKALGEIEVIAVNFDSWRQWNLRIHALPSEHTPVARELLTSLALPALKAKLMAAGLEPRHFSWNAKYDLANRSVRTD